MANKFLYLSNVCSKKEYDNIFNGNTKKSIAWQSMKFNRLFAEGLQKNGCSVDVLSSRPINRVISKELFYKQKNDCENGVNFNYLGFINFKILRQISLYFNASKSISRWQKTNKDGTIVCDILNYSLLKSAIRKKKKNKVIGIITDLPEILEGRLSFKIRQWNKLIKKCDGFVVLAKPMVDRLQLTKKPCVVIEGFCDIDMLDTLNKLECKYEKRVVLYSGCIHKKYGIKNLVDAFSMLNQEDIELHIYGSGDWQEGLEECCKSNKKIKYFGVKSNEEVVNAQMKSTLLVNPRPVDEEYVKYSFPSKNMEYIASGTPMLTTNLPSMPIEYKEHCFVVENNDIDLLKNKMEEILKIDKVQLYKFGCDAKKWALENKNNKVMAKKFLEELLETNE